VIVIIIFGASRLPQLGEGLGKAIKGFKKGIADSNDPNKDQNKPDSKA
jgi:sec-independent protein translocase protein TatA